LSVSTPSRPGSLLIAALTFLFVALRCLQLDADPPSSINGRESRELYAEPPAKSHEARNFALFGAFQLSRADDYQFWRAQSPAWVYPLAGFFHVFGTDYPQLRIFSTLYAALGFALLLAIAHQVSSGGAFVFVGLALAIDAVYFHTARVGFIEPAVGTWVTLAALALLHAERNLRWLIVAHVAFVFAFFSKQAAVYALPFIAFASGYRLLLAFQASNEDRKQAKLVIAAAVLLLVLSGLYIATSDYVRAVLHNVNHVILGSDAPPRNQYRGLKTLLFRLRDRERYAHFFSSIPVSGPIAVATLLAYGVQAVRTRRWPSYRAFVLLGWFASALFAMEVLAKSALRFWTIAVPPAALVAGLGLERAREWMRERGTVWTAQRALIALPLAAAMAWSAYGNFVSLRRPEYTVRDGAARLQQEIGARDATVVGFPSPGIVLGTPYKNFYVRGQFNAERAQILQLGITHLLLRDGKDATEDILQREFPSLMKKLQPRAELQVRGESLKLFDVESRMSSLSK
jgi:hypothetical protein